MKIINIFSLIDTNKASSSSVWKRASKEITSAISKVVNPPNSDKLTLRKISKDKKQRNGVTILKSLFASNILNQSKQWHSEYNVKTTTENNFKVGKTDFVFIDEATNLPLVLVEWETGNISSSHRSLNKMVLALKYKIVSHAVLVLPSRSLYTHLTDRIGNEQELSPYYDLWESFKNFIPKGSLFIYVVEHDELTEDPSFPYLYVGQDGNGKNNRSGKK